MLPEHDENQENDDVTQETDFDDDPDMKVIKDGEAEIAAEDDPDNGNDEEGGRATDADSEDVDDGEDQKTDDKTPDQNDTDADAPMIPKARFDQVLGDLSKTREELAKVNGQIEILSRQQAPKQDEAKQPTPEEVLQQIQDSEDALAEKFDSGDIGMAEYRRKQRELEAAKADVMANQQQPEQDATPQGGDDFILDAITDELEAKYPAVKELPADDPGWHFIQQAAVRSLESEGVQLGQGARSTIALRVRMAELAEQYVPILTGKPVNKPEQTPVPPKGKGASEQAQARKAKLEMQESLPPNTHRMGAEGSKELYSEEQIANMTDEQIAELPEALLAQIEK